MGGRFGDAELHAHHGVPRSKGGTDKISNLTTYCRDCHHAIHHKNKKAPTATKSNNPTDKVETIPWEELSAKGKRIQKLINGDDIADTYGQQPSEEELDHYIWRFQVVLCVTLAPAAIVHYLSTGSVLSITIAVFVISVVAFNYLDKILKSDS
jgi:hypothetical protein